MSLVVRFTLPLRLAPLQNELMRMHWARRRKLKSEVFWCLMKQGGRLRKPLAGRPMVLGIRCSTQRPDEDAGMGVKLVLDVLKADEQGLGYIVDDSPEHVDLRMMWAHAAKGKGELILEVWEDETESKSGLRLRQSDGGAHDDSATQGQGVSDLQPLLPRSAPDGEGRDKHVDIRGAFRSATEKLSKKGTAK